MQLELSQKSLRTFGHAFGGLSRRFFVSSDYKKISFLAKAIKLQGEPKVGGQ